MPWLPTHWLCGTLPLSDGRFSFCLTSRRSKQLHWFFCFSSSSSGAPLYSQLPSRFSELTHSAAAYLSANRRHFELSKCLCWHPRRFEKSLQEALRSTDAHLVDENSIGHKLVRMILNLNATQNSAAFLDYSCPNVSEFFQSRVWGRVLGNFKHFVLVMKSSCRRASSALEFEALWPRACITSHQLHSC